MDTRFRISSSGERFDAYAEAIAVELEEIWYNMPAFHRLDNFHR
jgi:hypothetical protein